MQLQSERSSLSLSVLWGKIIPLRQVVLSVCSRCCPQVWAAGAGRGPRATIRGKLLSDIVSRKMTVLRESCCGSERPRESSSVRSAGSRKPDSVYLTKKGEILVLNRQNLKISQQSSARENNSESKALSLSNLFSQAHISSWVGRNVGTAPADNGHRFTESFFRIYSFSICNILHFLSFLWGYVWFSDLRLSIHTIKHCAYRSLIA